MELRSMLPSLTSIYTGTVICAALEKRGYTNRMLVVNAYLDDIKRFEIRGVNPLKLDALVERVTVIVEDKIPVHK